MNCRQVTFILIVQNEYRIFEMSMKKRWTSDFYTHLGYSILISYILYVYGQAYVYRISKTSMNTSNINQSTRVKCPQTMQKAPGCLIGFSRSRGRH